MLHHHIVVSERNRWHCSAGVVRGCGRQKAGAFINLAAYYLAGIPSAFVFAFVWHLGGMASVLPCWPLQHFILGLHYFPFILQLFFYIFFELDIGSESWFFNLNSEQGLWFGIMCGLVVQMLLLLSITLFTNWNKEVSRSFLALHHTVLSSMHVVFLLFVSVSAIILLMGKLLQASKAKDRVFSSALPVDMATG